MADDDKDTKKTPTLEERVEALTAELAAERTARTKEIVKARHFADEVKTASEAAMAAEKERLAAAGAATTEAGSTHKATPGAAPAGKITKAEDVDKIEKHADRVKAIEDQLGDTPIP